jgi:hypothetical protein
MQKALDFTGGQERTAWTAIPLSSHAHLDWPGALLMTCRRFEQTSIFWACTLAMCVFSLLTTSSRVARSAQVRGPRTPPLMHPFLAGRWLVSSSPSCGRAGVALRHERMGVFSQGTIQWEKSPAQICTSVHRKRICSCPCGPQPKLFCRWVTGLDEVGRKQLHHEPLPGRLWL